jgi:hypothetical protein
MCSSRDLSLLLMKLKTCPSPLLARRGVANDTDHAPQAPAARRTPLVGISLEALFGMLPVYQGDHSLGVGRKAALGASPRGTLALLQAPEPAVEAHGRTSAGDTLDIDDRGRGLLASPGSSGRGRLRISSLVVNPDVPMHSAPPSREASAWRRPSRVRSVTYLVLAFVSGLGPSAPLR